MILRHPHPKDNINDTSGHNTPQKAKQKATSLPENLPPPKKKKKKKTTKKTIICVNHPKSWHINNKYNTKDNDDDNDDDDDDNDVSCNILMTHVCQDNQMH